MAGTDDDESCLLHHTWELIDGSVGRMPGNSQMAPGLVDGFTAQDAARWKDYRSTSERASAQAVSGR